MSINPVTTASPVTDPTIRGPEARVDARASSQVTAVQPNLGKQTEKETPKLKPSSTAPEMPRDEVQVQRVNGASGDIVIRYLDASGNLILQIPSSQLLGLARAVDQALEEQANRRAAVSESTQPGQGEAFHGR